MGGTHFGVRSSSEATDDLVRRLLAAHLVPGVEAPSNYSLRLAGRPDESDGDTELNLLYVSHTMAARSRSPRRVLEALLSYLSTDAHPAPGLLVSTALGLLHDGKAILAPRALLLDNLDRLQPHLHRHGLQIVDAQFSAIDPATGELAVRDPGVDADLAVLAELDGAVAEREAPAASPGRYPVGAWAFALGPDAVGPLPKALGLVHAQSTVNRLSLGAQSTLDALARVFTTATSAGLGQESPAQIARQMAGLLTN